MGDLSSSDCSWNKMVIAKANNQWISTIKLEHSDSDADPVSTKKFSFDTEHASYVNIKKEREETDGSSQNCQSQDSEMMMQEIDPLLVPLVVIPNKRTRRKGSGPKNETPEERAVRLAKMSAYAAQRLANETPAQRAARLKRMSEYAARRLAKETSEQRAKRLARMSAYAAQRLAKETPEQRQVRLARMSAYASRRLSILRSKKTGGGDDAQQVDVNMISSIPPNHS